MDKDVSLKKLVLTVIVCGLLSACGTTGSDQGDNSIAVEGAWSGNYQNTGQGSVPVLAIIQQDGPAYLFDTSGITYVFPSFTGSDSLDGTVHCYPAMGYRFTDGSAKCNLSLSGTALDSRINGDLTDPSTQASFGIQPLETLDGAPSVVSGQWDGYYISPTPTYLGLAMQADGSFSGDDGYGCHLTGRIDYIQSSKSLFAVTLASHGDSAACGGVSTGLAHESSVDTLGYFDHDAGRYYYLAVSGDAGAFVAEFRAD